MTTSFPQITNSTTLESIVLSSSSADTIHPVTTKLTSAEITNPYQDIHISGNAKINSKALVSYIDRTGTSNNVTTESKNGSLLKLIDDYQKDIQSKKLTTKSSHISLQNSFNDYIIPRFNKLEDIGTTGSARKTALLNILNASLLKSSDAINNAGGWSLVQWDAHDRYSELLEATSIISAQLTPLDTPVVNVYTDTDGDSDQYTNNDVVLTSAKGLKITYTVTDGTGTSPTYETRTVELLNIACHRPDNNGGIINVNSGLEIEEMLTWAAIEFADARAAVNQLETFENRPSNEELGTLNSVNSTGLVVSNNGSNITHSVRIDSNNYVQVQKSSQWYYVKKNGDDLDLTIHYGQALTLTELENNLTKTLYSAHYNESVAPLTDQQTIHNAYFLQDFKYNSHTRDIAWGGAGGVGIPNSNWIVKSNERTVVLNIHTGSKVFVKIPTGTTVVNDIKGSPISYDDGTASYLFAATVMNTSFFVDNGVTRRRYTVNVHLPTAQIQTDGHADYRPSNYGIDVDVDDDPENIALIEYTDELVSHFDHMANNNKLIGYSAGYRHTNYADLKSAVDQDLTHKLCLKYDRTSQIEHLLQISTVIYDKNGTDVGTVSPSLYFIDKALEGTQDFTEYANITDKNDVIKNAQIINGYEGVEVQYFATGKPQKSDGSGDISVGTPYVKIIFSNSAISDYYYARVIQDTTSLKSEHDAISRLNLFVGRDNTVNSSNFSFTQLDPILHDYSREHQKDTSANSSTAIYGGYNDLDPDTNSLNRSKNITTDRDALKIEQFINRQNTITFQDNNGLFYIESAADLIKEGTRIRNHVQRLKALSSLSNAINVGDVITHSITGASGSVIAVTHTDENTQAKSVHTTIGTTAESSSDAVNDSITNFIYVRLDDPHNGFIDINPENYTFTRNDVVQTVSSSFLVSGMNTSGFVGTVIDVSYYGGDKHVGIDSFTVEFDSNFYQDVGTSHRQLFVGNFENYPECWQYEDNTGNWVNFSTLTTFVNNQGNNPQIIRSGNGVDAGTVASSSGISHVTIENMNKYYDSKKINPYYVPGFSQFNGTQINQIQVQDENGDNVNIGSASNIGNLSHTVDGLAVTYLRLRRWLYGVNENNNNASNGISTEEKAILDLYDSKDWHTKSSSMNGSFYFPTRESFSNKLIELYDNYKIAIDATLTEKFDASGGGGSDASFSQNRTNAQNTINQQVGNLNSTINGHLNTYKSNYTQLYQMYNKAREFDKKVKDISQFMDNLYDGSCSQPGGNNFWNSIRGNIPNLPQVTCMTMKDANHENDVPNINFNIANISADQIGNAPETDDVVENKYSSQINRLPRFDQQPIPYFS